MALILVEGNISASKSTVVQGLNGVRFPEPLMDENPWLELFYKDSKENATYMQLYTLFYRYKQWKLAQAMDALNPKKIYLLDRSLYFDHTFAKINHDLGNISDRQMELYQMAHSILQEQIYFPDLCLWLRVSPEVCLERLKLRARGCEVGVTLDYLKLLEDAYCKAMETMKKKCPVVEINGEQDRESVLRDCQKAIDNRINEQNHIWPKWKGGL
jgi:deoxyadenosine/deoxycytidine kinase